MSPATMLSKKDAEDLKIAGAATDSPLTYDLS